MKCIVLAAGLAMSAAMPALAQSHAGHNPAPVETPSTDGATAASACTPEHAAMGHCTMPTANSPADTDGGSACSDEHARMGHCTRPAPKLAPAPADDPACPPEHAAMGHCTPKGVSEKAGAVGTDLPSGDGVPPPPAAPNYADRIWGAAAMQPTRDALRHDHGGGIYRQVMIDLAEVRFGSDGESFVFEGDAWLGGDINRLVLKAEGEGAFGEAVDSIETTALYSRAIGPYFNAQAGVRQDFGTGPDRTHAVVGIEGLAPYWFEVDAYAFLSTRGDLTFSISAEYDQRLTQRLILQPRVELAFSAQRVPELELGSGLTGAEFGLRLRYEIVREFAPYVGIVHETKFGSTADFVRAVNENPSSTSVVVGLRAWF